MKYIKLFEDFKVEDIPQSEPQFTQWIIKNAPKSFTNPQEWFEEELVKPEPDWAYIGFIIKELGLANRLSIPKGAKEELEIDGWSKNHIESFSLLHWATMNNHTELAKGLIDAGADLNAKDYAKKTPLHYVAEGNRPELARVLIDAGADLNAEDYAKQTPLHLAAMKGHTEIAKGLIDAGADLNAEDEDKQTPLHYAATYYEKAIVKILIDAGAKLDVQDKWEKTPWYYANSYMRKEIPELKPKKKSL
jgi:ankyrin repeat protein